MNWRSYCAAAAAIVFIAGASALTVSGQSQFKAGDRVEADVNMSSSPANAKWRKATVVEVMMWQGKVSGIYVRTDEGTEHTLRAEHLRRLAGPAAATGRNSARQPAGTNNPPAREPVNDNDSGQQTPIFKPGDRVEIDSIMANDPNRSGWRKATVKAYDPANRRYVVIKDHDGLEMSVLIRPGKTWIRPLNDGSSAPKQPECPFTKPAGRVTKNAAASAGLFKRVIWEWNDSIKRGSKLGITFQVFSIGPAFRNVLTGKGRLEDMIPTNALIYPVKTRQLVCEQHPTLITRVVRDINYSCFKNEFGDWVCRNGAPRELERKSIYLDQ